MSIVLLVMQAQVQVVEQRRARGEGLKCVDVDKGMLEVVVDALIEEVAEEVSGCLFVVIATSRMLHADVDVDVVEAKSILSTLFVRISILHGLLHLLSHNLPNLHQHQQRIRK
jgi:hypothetical protein